MLMELLKKGKNKYAKLILEHNCNSKWLMKPQGPLVSLDASFVQMCQLSIYSFYTEMLKLSAAVAGPTGSVQLVLSSRVIVTRFHRKITSYENIAIKRVQCGLLDTNF